jgi:hypothetical protein
MELAIQMVLISGKQLEILKSVPGIDWYSSAFTQAFTIQWLSERFILICG